MAAPAGIPDVRGIHGGSRVAGLDDLVFAVAIRAQRRLDHAARQGLPVHAGPVLLRHFGVAHATGIRNRGTKRLGLGRQQLVGGAMAEGAIRGALVALFPGLAVHAEGVITGLLRVALGAGGLGDATGCVAAM